MEKRDEFSFSRIIFHKWYKKNCKKLCILMYENTYLEMNDYESQLASLFALTESWTLLAVGKKNAQFKKKSSIKYVQI